MLSFWTICTMKKYSKISFHIKNRGSIPENLFIDFDKSKYKNHAILFKKWNQKEKKKPLFSKIDSIFFFPHFYQIQTFLSPMAILFSITNWDPPHTKSTTNQTIIGSFWVTIIASYEHIIGGFFMHIVSNFFFWAHSIFRLLYS